MKKENKVAGIHFTAATKKISEGNFRAQVILNICYADKLPSGKFIESKVYWDSSEITHEGDTGQASLWRKQYATRARAKSAANTVRIWYFENCDPLAHRVSA